MWNLAIVGALLVTRADFQAQQIKTIPSLHALAFAAAPSGSRVAATFEDNSVRIFDASVGSTVKVLGTRTQPAWAVAWSRDGREIASGDETGRIAIWTVANGAKVNEYRPSTRGIETLSFNHDGTLLLSTGKDDTLCVYNIPTGKLMTIKGKGANFYGGHFFPASNGFAAATLQEGARIYNAGGQLIKTIHGHAGLGAIAAAVNPLGNLLATGGRDSKATLWFLPSGQEVGSFVGHQDWVNAVAFSPNGRLIATSCGVDRTVKIWDVATRRPVQSIENESSQGSPIGWTADGKYLLTRSFDDSLVVSQVSPPQAGELRTVHARRARRRRR